MAGRVQDLEVLLSGTFGSWLSFVHLKPQTEGSDNVETLGPRNEFLMLGWGGVSPRLSSNSRPILAHVRLCL